jgi:methylenetetrahydrofolate reductase (NADPH)
MITNPLPSFGGSTAVPPLTATAIGLLASHASFEMVPAEAAQLELTRGLIPAGSAIILTAVPGDSLQVRLSAARAVREAGFEPVPCLAARRLADRTTAHRVIARFREEAAVSRILLVGGDDPVPDGQFSSALELLVELRRDPHGMEGIGFAAYPEGHPTIPRAVLEADLDTKLAVAEDAGLAPFIVTQFAFDARPVVAWLESLRARGCTVPVSIGLAGPAPIRTLLRHARICGAGPSARGLVGKGASLARMLHETGPDPVIRDLAQAGLRERLGPVSLHLFPFGGLARTARWMAPVFKGQVLLHSSESGFRAQS